MSHSLGNQLCEFGWRESLKIHVQVLPQILNLNLAQYFNPFYKRPFKLGSSSAREVVAGPLQLSRTTATVGQGSDEDEGVVSNIQL